MKYLLFIFIVTLLSTSCGVKKTKTPCDAYGNGKLYNKSKK